MQPPTNEAGKPGEEPGPVPTAGFDSALLDIIRTETVLSRLPIHNLAKKGSVNIQILKKTEMGEVELKWEVSYNARYGEARQLAYKLDTIVVNQRIDDAGRPLAKILRIGSLNEICAELGLAVDQGKNTRNIKNAFLQNVGTLITAEFQYRWNDGSEHFLKAGFTRYSVIFSGENLPDGRTADAVYVVFNNPFWEVLNNAPVRPLNRSYMKELPPAPQRFYEIISYKIFSALKNEYSFAKLLYSEYCTLSAQVRHYERQPVQDQMAKVLRPHKESGYIASVKYEATTDPLGNSDWLMLFTPGPTARAEYAAVHRGKSAPIDLDLPETEERSKRKTGPRQQRLKLKPAEEFTPQFQERGPAPSEPSADTAPEFDESLIAELAKRGIGEMESRKLLAKLAPGQPVMEQLEYADAVLRNPKSPIRNPPGFYISRLQENFPVPEHFETSAKRKLREEAERRRNEERVERETLEIAYGEYCRNEIDRYVAEQVPAPDFAKLVSRETSRLKADRSTHLPPDTLRAMAERAVKKRLAEQIPIPLLTFDQFRDREGSGRDL